MSKDVESVAKIRLGSSNSYFTTEKSLYIAINSILWLRIHSFLIETVGFLLRFHQGTLGMELPLLFLYSVRESFLPPVSLSLKSLTNV